MKHSLAAAVVILIMVCMEGAVFGSDVIVFKKWSNNPIAELPSGALFPEVIFDGKNYKMYFTLNGDIYLAISTDGINWTVYGRVLTKGPSGSWEEDAIIPGSVIFNGTAYMMWYQGNSKGQGRVGLAMSTDGIRWTKYAGNPVLSPGGNGGWDDWNIWSPVVTFNGTHYVMLYAAQSVIHEYPHGVGMAYSEDGIHWTKYSKNPVIPGANEVDRWSHCPSALIFDGREYKLWYSGEDGPSGTFRIWYANSSDAISWTRYPDKPVLTPSDTGWDSQDVRDPAVLKIGDSFWMWYWGYDGSTSGIGFAYTSEPTINQAPLAVIDSVTPNPATQGEVVQFYGHGSDPDGKIVAYKWISSIDGLLSESDSFSTSELTAGKHTIYFMVQDDDGAWSDKVTITLVINPREIGNLSINVKTKYNMNTFAIGDEVEFFGKVVDDYDNLVDNAQIKIYDPIEDEYEYVTTDSGVFKYSYILDREGTWEFVFTACKSGYICDSTRYVLKVVNKVVNKVDEYNVEYNVSEVANVSEAAHAEEEYELLWSYETGGIVDSVSVSSDGSYVAAGSYGTVYYFTRSGELLWSYETGGEVHSVSVSSDGSYVAAGSDKKVYYFARSDKLLWSYDTGGSSQQ